VKGKYFQPITSIAPKLTTTTEIDVDSFKIGTFHELVHDSGFSEVFVQLQYIAVLWCAPCHILILEIIHTAEQPALSQLLF
jgi:hypothetical protein